MWEYSFLVLTVLVSIGSLYKKLKDYQKVNTLNKMNFNKLKKNSDVHVATEERRMTYIFIVICAFAIMLLWVKDNSGFYFMKCIAIYVLIHTIAELVLSQQKYSLYYNSSAFAYRGGYFKFKDIKAVGYSKVFFQPSKLYLNNGQSYICFKKGCDAIHSKILHAN